ncbi:MAG: hypothetical protein E2604_00925 [Flavobacterium sp.]|nr:hypothetical protein [Flavobacterium sp.]
MKTINLSEIKEQFDNLLNNKTSREEAASWACELQDAQDSGLLEYDPLEKEVIIWNAIQFLQGVDLQDAPNEYLHNLDDLEKFRSQL